ncbi:MAG: archease [Planctomycetes bacterium]|nr:archease [Planctomycetota bacterium]
MAAGYELIDHTGDIGIRVHGGTRPELFETAARALYDILVEARDVRPQREEEIVVEGETDEMLREWLAELLYRFSVDGTIYREYDIRIEGRRMSAKVRGERLDPARHALRTELKAVTYHGLFARPEGDGWVAEVIFDV